MAQAGDNDDVGAEVHQQSNHENREDRNLRRRDVKLGQGLAVPYPEPRDGMVTRVAKGNRRKDTKPEIRLRSALHQRGLRFRKDYLLRLAEIRVRPDIVFTRAKLAVFVDGCFWHGCPQHQKLPTRNPDYWIPKLQRNADRDKHVNEALATAGWTVVRIWEHEDVQESAEHVAALVRQIASPI